MINHCQSPTPRTKSLTRCCFGEAQLPKAFPQLSYDPQKASPSLPGAGTEIILPRRICAAELSTEKARLRLQTSEHPAGFPPSLPRGRAPRRRPAPPSAAGLSAARCTAAARAGGARRGRGRGRRGRCGVCEARAGRPAGERAGAPYGVWGPRRREA